MRSIVHSCMTIMSSLSFNSLFEMRRLWADRRSDICWLLSILYLRCCLLRPKMTRIGSAFNSLFEMRYPRDRSPRPVGRPALSILYLRCWDPLTTASRAGQSLFLSILYLRCNSIFAATNLRYPNIWPFNSLFEMQGLSQGGHDQALKGQCLSILYLRCTSGATIQHLKKSMPHLSILYLRCAYLSVLYVLLRMVKDFQFSIWDATRYLLQRGLELYTFNSLFEMPFAIYLYDAGINLANLSILYLRCGRRTQSAYLADPSSFNSLFEMQQMLQSLPPVVRELYFQFSIWDAPCRGHCARRRDEEVIFQFSIWDA